MTNILNTLRELLDKFIDQFKLKNPLAFTIVAGLIYAIWFILDSLLSGNQITDFAVNIPVLGQVYVIDAIIKTLVLLLTLSGAHTPKPPQLDIPITPHTEITEP